VAYTVSFPDISILPEARLKKKLIIEINNYNCSLKLYDAIGQTRTAHTTI